MDADEANAKGAELAGLVVSAAVSAIPFVGGAASVIAQYIGNIPAQRRVERILKALQGDLTRAFEVIDGVELQVIESEEFNAAVFRVVRESLETADESKRQQLRNALINGYVRPGSDERDRFLALVAKYEPWHARVLDALQTTMRGRDRLLDSAASHISGSLGGSLDYATVRDALQDLVSDGLAVESTVGEVREQSRGSIPGRQPRTEQIVVQKKFHNITERGSQFLLFVRTPFGD